MSESDDGSNDLLTEVVHARGHENVSSTHASTFEVTTEDFLTPAGDCILAIEADRAPTDFDPAFVSACQDAAATISMTISAGGYDETITGRGDPRLTFESERSAVGRTSDYVDDRTVLVEADAAADGIDRDLVDALAEGARARVTVAVEDGKTEE